MTQPKRVYKGIPLGDRMEPHSDDSREMRDLRKELKEEKGWRQRLWEEVEGLKRDNARFAEFQTAMYESFIIERNDLAVRISRIDQRIKALGFEAPSAKVDVGR